MISLDEVLAELPAERREEIERRAAQLIAEEMTMRGLRKARKAALCRLTRKLGVTHEQLAPIEHQTDLQIAALRHSVEALGGKLTLIAEFPDGAPVVLAGFGTIADSGPREDAPAPPRRPAKKSKAPGTFPVHTGTAIHLQS